MFPNLLSSHIIRTIYFDLRMSFHVQYLRTFICSFKSRQKPYYFFANWLSRTVTEEYRSESHRNKFHTHPCTVLGSLCSINDRRIELMK